VVAVDEVVCEGADDVVVATEIGILEPEVSIVGSAVVVVDVDVVEVVGTAAAVVVVVDPTGLVADDPPASRKAVILLPGDAILQG
jgi:hypothetical protein